MSMIRTWTNLVMTAVGVVLLAGMAQGAYAAAPIIDVTVTPDGLVAAGDPIRVWVFVDDPSTIVSVTANGVSLPKRSWDLWFGTLMAVAPLGFHQVLVEVRDIYGNVVQDGNNGYTTARVVATKIDALSDPVAALARGQFLFVVCGKVTEHSSDCFLDDGSGSPAVVLEGYTCGLRDGDFARVRGTLWYGPNGYEPALIDPQTVQKLN